MVRVFQGLCVVGTLLFANSVYAEEDEQLEIGFIEFLGEGKKVDGQWVDPTMIEDETLAGTGEDEDE